MPKFMELIKTENKIEIRNLSMFIMKLEKNFILISMHLTLCLYVIVFIYV